MAIYDDSLKRWVEGPALPTVKVATPTMQPPVKVVQAKPKATVKPALTFYRDDGTTTIYDNTGRRYKNRQEFLKAGGQWDKVIVRKSANNGFPTDLKVVNSQPQGTITKVTGAPPKQQKTSTLTKIQNALTPKGVVANTIYNLPEAAASVAKGIVQSTARTGASFVTTPFSMIAGETDSSKYTIDNKLFGKPVEPLNVFAEKQRRSGQQFAEDKGASKGVAGLAGLGYAALSVGGAELDFVPGSKAGKAALKELAAVSDVASTSRILKDIGLTDDVIREIGPIIRQTTNADDIARIIASVKKPVTATAKSVKRIDSLTKSEMVDAIDYLRLKRPYNQRVEENIGYLAEKFGVKSKTPARIADELENLVSTTKDYNIKSRDLASQAGFLDPQAIADDVTEAATQARKTFKTEWIDKYSPLQDLVGKTKISTDKNPYIAARLYAGHVGKIENRLDDLSDTLFKHKEKLPDIKEYALLDRYQELSGRGISKFPGGLTIDEINAQKAALEAKLGPEGVAQVQDALTGIRKYNDRLLTEAKDAGIISEASYKAIKQNNEKYIPLQRLEYLAEAGDDLPRGSRSFSVPTQNIIKAIKGSEKAVVDPIEAMVRNTYKAVSLIERNKVAQKVADLSQLPEFKDVVIKIDKSGVPLGMEKFSVFRNGIKEEYAVPKDVGAALKNLNTKEVDIITKWIGATGSNLLRKGATTLNIGFIPANAIRDYQTARLASNVGFNAVDWVRGLAAAVNRGDTYKAFLESGGASGFYEIEKSLPKTVRSLTASKGTKILKTVVNPVKLLELVGETIELAPRLGVFQKTLKKGMSSTEAAFNARNATVDFARSGNTMQLFNKWVPFLNARLQGTINSGKGLAQGLKKNPIGTAWKLTTLIGMPLMATYLNNTQRYPEIWDNVTDQDKRNNFIIIYGDEKDKDGNYSQVVKIPKGEIKIITNPIESFLDYLRGKDPKSFGKLALEIGSDISPIGFEREGKFSGTQAISNVTPPIPKGVLEAGFNKNFYTGRDIVPQNMIDASPREQYDKNTSPVAKALGKALNWSPKKIDNFIGTVTAGLGRQLSNPQAAPAQIESRFFGVKADKFDQKILENAKQAVTAQEDKRIQRNRRAAELLEQLKTQSAEQAAQDFDAIAKYEPEVAKKIIELKNAEEKNFNMLDYTITDLGIENGERAKFIKYQFDVLKSDEEKAAFWDDLVAKELITEKVAKQLTELLGK